jgi:hypothetical protein
MLPRTQPELVSTRRKFRQAESITNSGLGIAITYLLKHWDRLTLYLKQPGAPLDNNIAERGLKKPFFIEKIRCFIRLGTAPRMGDLFMSFIHTCELCGANPFDYLSELQQHAAELKSKPSDWMPWNYRGTLQRTHRTVDTG